MSLHAIVVPLFGAPEAELDEFLADLRCHGFFLVVVDNNPNGLASFNELSCDLYIVNANRGGIAGGFNRGVEAAIEAGAQWVTLLDQDSRLSPAALDHLRGAWHQNPEAMLVVGPMIWDRARGEIHGKARRHAQFDASSGRPWLSTRLLISSGSTFATRHWDQLGCFCEDLFIDFVDHAWSFRAQARGFRLLQHADVYLEQLFGSRHPVLLCRLMGMQLYSPIRHYYGLRNLRWLLSQAYIPLDLRIKEVVKMLFKPWMWLLFEPNRRANLSAIFRALIDPLPACGKV